ncbi:recombinase family protein [Thalassobaculum sp. OXR-137]|uniref:recombinase family protein n=1 Tax=Thalassobaculum sp. OXR-137 TaxID=3100173 RepID=UPI002AC9CACD|nr:recombinase family protein [Thalassobaculum sp. OXR-137]WPZ35529.1 recombinase family protein [Thalassobaculum sp. OXR-137]
MGRIYGYGRVSTDDQDLGLQTDALLAAGVADGDIFTDQGISGSCSDRPGLDRLLATVERGDVIVIWRLDRLGRSVVHLANMAEDLSQRGVGLRSLSDGVDTSTATGRLVYSILSSLAEFERETIRERVKAGMAAAKKRGVGLGRRPALTSHQREHAKNLRAEGHSCASVAAILGVDRSTVWRATQ